MGVLNIGGGIAKFLAIYLGRTQKIPDLRNLLAPHQRRGQLQQLWFQLVGQVSLPWGSGNIGRFTGT